MRASTEVRSEQAEALALRMGKHFGHKALVETEGDVTRVHTRFGPFELEPASDVLRVRASAGATDDLALLEQLIASHLGRFARGEELEVVWSREA
jgi:uncharacterized protein